MPVTRRIIPPIVTPLHADETLDLPGLTRHIDRQLAAGVNGIFVLGTTGEFYAFDEGEKEQVMAAAVAHVNGRCPVYAGTGAESTREVIRLTRLAATLGITGVSIITPYFIKPKAAELQTHFQAVADSTDLEVLLYNNPATCGGVNIDPSVVGKLAEHPRIVGIKDSSGDLQNTLEILQRTDPEKFCVLVGRDTLILASLLVGAHGAIPASCNVAPEFCVGILKAFEAGDMPRARYWQDKLHPVRTSLSMGTGNGAVKEALDIIGISAGPNRRPILSLSDSDKAKLKVILEQAGLIPS